MTTARRTTMTTTSTDLHLHSTASDGKLSPKDLVMWAHEKGLNCIALTDHDTTAGIEEAKATAKKLNITCLAGIELSTKAKCEVHILGYNIDYKNKEFVEELEKIKQSRIERNKLLKNKLESLKIFLNIDETAYGVGRMHFARKMVEKDICQNTNEAFDKFLGTNGQAYVSSIRLKPLEAVKLISKFGGTPVLAHPKKFLQDGSLELFLNGLVPYGLKGLECYYPSHNETDVKTLLAMAKKHGLIATGGSDFHGDEVFKYPQFELSPKAKAVLKTSSQS